ncbi:MAG: Hsp20/alpha crystallin family protein [bacterium]
MTTLQVYRPFKDLFRLSSELDRLFNYRGTSAEDEESPSTWSPAVDISEDKEAVKFRAELPGLKKEDVKINVREGVLTLQGERKFEEEKKDENHYRIERSYGVFARSFTLPTSVDESKIQATMKDGVLEIRVPKKPEAKEKEISIEVH